MTIYVWMSTSTLDQTVDNCASGLESCFLCPSPLNPSLASVEMEIHCYFKNNPI